MDGQSRQRHIRLPGVRTRQSADVRGQARHPEETLIAALVECHLLSYLYVATQNGIVVESYTDAATGILLTEGDGTGRFEQVTLRPVVTISAGDPEVARAIHADANRLCFIAASVNFPVHHEPEIRLADDRN
jgi:organic hydroperoxide reductase OsmC/OhrA